MMLQGSPSYMATPHLLNSQPITIAFTELSTVTYERVSYNILYLYLPVTAAILASDSTVTEQLIPPQLGMGAFVGGSGGGEGC